MPLSQLLEATNISSRSIFLASALVSIWCLSVFQAVNDLLRRTRSLCSVSLLPLPDPSSSKFRFLSAGNLDFSLCFWREAWFAPYHEYFLAGWPSLLCLTLGLSVGFLWPRNVDSHDSPPPGEFLNVHVWSSLVSCAPVPHQENNRASGFENFSQVSRKTKQNSAPRALQRISLSAALLFTKWKLPFCTSS